MKRLTKKDKAKIEEVRNRKERTIGKVFEILNDICKDNPNIFKKFPERRVKSLERIEEKMKSAKKCNISNFERYVRDIAGARVTCCTRDEIQEAEALIKKHPEIKKCKVLRRYDQPPDEDGYRGHHLEVTVHVFYENKTLTDICEVQIRTLASDLWAVLSHRDFYGSPIIPPTLVRRDMRTLSKQLEVVDDLAVSLKQRIRDEVNREAREKAKMKLAEKDMLTPDNVINLIRKTFKKKIHTDFAYQLMGYALSHDVISLKEYKRLITKHRTMIEDIYKAVRVSPPLEDYVYAPIFAKWRGVSEAKKVLFRRAKTLYARVMAPVEKGVEISKEELKKEIKTSQPTQRKKKR